jgi:hypothetical protein
MGPLTGKSGRPSDCSANLLTLQVQAPEAGPRRISRGIQPPQGVPHRTVQHGRIDKRERKERTTHPPPGETIFRQHQSDLAGGQGSESCRWTGHRGREAANESRAVESNRLPARVTYVPTAAARLLPCEQARRTARAEICANLSTDRAAPTRIPQRWRRRLLRPNSGKRSGTIALRQTERTQTRLRWTGARESSPGGDRPSATLRRSAHAGPVQTEEVWRPARPPVQCLRHRR